MFCLHHTHLTQQFWFMNLIAFPQGFNYIIPARFDSGILTSKRASHHFTEQFWNTSICEPCVCVHCEKLGKIYTCNMLKWVWSSRKCWTWGVVWGVQGGLGAQFLRGANQAPHSGDPSTAWPGGPLPPPRVTSASQTPPCIGMQAAQHSLALLQ